MALLSSGYAALVVLTSTIGGKIYMSVRFRLQQVVSTVKVRLEIEQTPAYLFASRSQLNDAEYSPLIIALLLYLDASNIPAQTAATIAAAGSVFYLWSRLICGKKWFMLASIGAVGRYVGIGLLGFEIYKKLAA